MYGSLLKVAEGGRWPGGGATPRRGESLIVGQPAGKTLRPSTRVFFSDFFDWSTWVTLMEQMYLYLAALYLRVAFICPSACRRACCGQPPCFESSHATPNETSFAPVDGLGCALEDTVNLSMILNYILAISRRCSTQVLPARICESQTAFETRVSGEASCAKALPLMRYRRPAGTLSMTCSASLKYLRLGCSIPAMLSSRR